MKIMAIIPARGGSKRLENKNIYPIWGKPMLYWAIQACKNSSFKIDVCVSSDSDEILQVARDLGVKTHRRGNATSNDKAYKQTAIREAAHYLEENYGKNDVYISLQANSPTVLSDQIDLGIKTLIEYNKDEIFSVDSNLLQNAAFRIFKGDYVFQEDLSTNCGVVIAEAYDVHTLEDIKKIERETIKI
jgi:CMP-N-acetylneuraminic acid synthetase